MDSLVTAFVPHAVLDAKSFYGMIEHRFAHAGFSNLASHPFAPFVFQRFAGSSLAVDWEAAGVTDPPTAPSASLPTGCFSTASLSTVCCLVLHCALSARTPLRAVPIWLAAFRLGGQAARQRDPDNEW